MKLLQAIVASMLASGSALAVPGAAPRQICDYAPPEYSAREVAAVREYGQCLAKAADAQAGNLIAQKCNDMVNAVNTGRGAATRSIECGSGPEHKYCSVPVAIGWCTYASAARKAFSDLYACDELVRRYPDLGPVIKACEPLAEARRLDVQKQEAARKKCSIVNAEGYAVIAGTCRRPRTVVPPGIPRPD